MGRNIVLLSDGTGNGAASPFKTNIWRLYQAIDIQPPSGDKCQQIVFYDDGVGTENFKPLAALGGALGIGVWGNVKELYTFACHGWRDASRGFAEHALKDRVNVLEVIAEVEVRLDLLCAQFGRHILVRF